jgi:hypothetical protein
MSSTLSNIAGSIQQNKNLQAQANADYASAESTRRAGMAEEENILSQTRAAAGSAEASAAGSGVVFNEGSALDNIKRTVYQGTKDAMTARNNAYGQAANLQSTAESLESSKSSTFGILMSGLSGVGSDISLYSGLYSGVSDWLSGTTQASVTSTSQYVNK